MAFAAQFRLSAQVQHTAQLQHTARLQRSAHIRVVTQEQPLEWERLAAAGAGAVLAETGQVVAAVEVVSICTGGREKGEGGDGGRGAGAGGDGMGEGVDVGDHGREASAGAKQE